MKNKSIFKLLFVLTISATLVSTTKIDNEKSIFSSSSDLLSDFWFGYYQEDAASNPEDPMPGFIYLKIPKSGVFNGELYFSYIGCVNGTDIGNVKGTATGINLKGTWDGNVDGKTVGGSYIGSLNKKGQYQGTYTNKGGKIQIECSKDFKYYVAPKGTWFLQKASDNKDLNVSVDNNKDTLSVNWKGGSAGLVYSKVFFIDAECLSKNLSLEKCLMWSGMTTGNSIVYGKDKFRTDPAKALVRGKTYIVSVSSFTDTGKAVGTSNFTFIK